MTRRLGLLLKTASWLAAGAVVFYSIKRRATRRTRDASAAGLPDIVEETSAESFPASDPPSWTSAALL